jgi:hypothetical protein
MTRPFTAAAAEPVLFVSLRRCPDSFAKSFGTVTPLGSEQVKLVQQRSRVLYFCRLADYRGTAN